jgi:hypothetical protein
MLEMLGDRCKILSENSFCLSGDNPTYSLSLSHNQTYVTLGRRRGGITFVRYLAFGMAAANLRTKLVPLARLVNRRREHEIENSRVGSVGRGRQLRNHTRAGVDAVAEDIGVVRDVEESSRRVSGNSLH